MKTTCKIVDSGRSDLTGKLYLKIEIDGDIDPTLRNKSLDVELKPHRAKRSLDANAYYWKLLSLMAEKLRISNNEIHNIMLARYGYPEVINNSLVTVPLKEDIDHNKIEGIHLKPSGHSTVNSKGTVFTIYILMRGSHTYNTLEMSRLIDGVISEAQELGIDTLTPEEKARMMAAYEKYHTK